jgi:hypothetical protein
MKKHLYEKYMNETSIFVGEDRGQVVVFLRIAVRTKILYSSIFWDIRARAHQGNWQPQRNRNFRELLSA